MADDNGSTLHGWSALTLALTKRAALDLWYIVHDTVPLQIDVSYCFYVMEKGR